MSLFEGVATALITPFSPDGSVNYAKLEELINKQIEDGVDGLVICGTTGESATLTEKEHMDVIRESVKFVNGRVPVIAGTGSNCTQTAIEMSKEAEEYGADGLLLVSPYYNKATAEGLYEHFADTANAVKIPVILYNIAGRTGINIEPETIYKLARDIKNIVAVKEASGKSVYGDLSIDFEGRRVYIKDNEINLTAKEFDLLELLVKDENKVYSREKLLDIIWGSDYPGDVRTVDVHIRRLREKIEETPGEPRYIHTKWGVGYYFKN